MDTFQMGSNEKDTFDLDTNKINAKKNDPNKMDTMKNNSNNKMDSKKITKIDTNKIDTNKTNTNKSDTSLSKKSPKRNIYQVQKAIDHSKIKPQNSWKIYKKLTIFLTISTSNSPFSDLEFFKEIAPKIYEELKDNLSDLSMNTIKTPIPFYQTIRNSSGSQEMDLRYLLIDSSCFQLESKDYLANIYIVDSEEQIPKKYVKKPLAIVFLTENQLNSTNAIDAIAEIQDFLFFFDVNSMKQSFESLRNFIKKRAFAIQEERIEAMNKEIKFAGNFDVTKPFKMTENFMNEIALRLAFISNSKEKDKFFIDLSVRFGRPPEPIFRNLKRTLETLALKFVQEIRFSRQISYKPKKSTIFLENISCFKLTEREIKEFAVFALEQMFFGSKNWKKEIYLSIGRPVSEVIWKEIRSDIEKKINSLKHSFEKHYQQLYFCSKPSISKPKLHLKYMGKGDSLRKRKNFVENLADFLLKHKFLVEISKETLKILLGNPDAALKNPREISELKQITLDLQAKLQKINDERTTLAYLQQDFNAIENRALSQEKEQAKELEKLRVNSRKFEKVMVLFAENCEKSQDFAKNSAKIYQIREENSMKIWRISMFSIKNYRWREIKKKLKSFSANRVIFIVSDESFDVMKSLFEEIFEEKSLFKGVIFKLKSFEKEKSNENSSFLENFAKKFSYKFLEENGQISMKNLIKILNEREKPIEDNLRKNLLDFLEEKSENSSKNYQQFFEFLSQSEAEDLNKELINNFFLEFFQIKARNSQYNINEFTDALLTGLRRIELAIEQKEQKNFEISEKKMSILQKIEEYKEINPNYLALKLEEFEEIEQELKKNKKLFCAISYGNIRTNAKEIKSNKIKEKFLFPLEKTADFLEIWLKNENNVLIEIFKIKTTESQEKASGSIKIEKTLKIKMKFIDLEQETMKINLKNIEKLQNSNSKILENLYQFKYDFLEVLARKNLEADQKNIEPFEASEYTQKMEENLDIFRQQIKENEDRLSQLKSSQNNEKMPESQIKSKEIEKNLETYEKNSEYLLIQKQLKTSKMIEEISSQIELQKKELNSVISSKLRFLSTKQQIADFFNAVLNKDIAPSNLLKLSDYFLYFQKAILKFYVKASLIEADLFELKKSTKKALLKDGLSMLAGSVPFIGDILKIVVQKTIEMKEKYDETKLVNKCTKFCVLINSSEILAEILEESALLLIKDKEKQTLIFAVEEFKENFWDKLKKKIMAFLHKAKEKLFGKTKKKEEKLLKDIDTPAKLLANIDAAYVCAHAASRLETEGNTLEKFDSEDPYCKKPLVQLFTGLVGEISSNFYEKVLDFNNEKKEVYSVEELDKEIEKFTEKNSVNCLEEIKRNSFIEEESIVKEAKLEEKIEVSNEITISFDEIKAKEKDIEEKLEKLLNWKNSQRFLLGSHGEKLNDLEEKFKKIEMGAKAGILFVKEIKDNTTALEFEINEETKALTRNAEAIPEKFVFFEKYKSILMKRKALK